MAKWMIHDNDKTDDQRDGFAIKACHMMGKSVEEASRALNMDELMVAVFYTMIEDNLVDFDTNDF